MLYYFSQAWLRNVYEAKNKKIHRWIGRLGKDFFNLKTLITFLISLYLFLLSFITPATYLHCQATTCPSCHLNQRGIEIFSIFSSHRSSEAFQPLGFVSLFFWFCCAMSFLVDFAVYWGAGIGIGAGGGGGGLFRNFVVDGGNCDVLRCKCRERWRWLVWEYCCWWWRLWYVKGGRHDGFEEMVEAVVGTCFVDAVGDCGGHSGATVIIVLLVVQVIMLVLLYWYY